MAPLEACMSAIIDYRGKSPRKTPHGIPLVTAKVVKGGRITDEHREYIDPEDYEIWMRRGLPARGDVLLTTEAPLGEVAQLDGRKVALAQRLITLRAEPNRLDNTYLKFLMQSSFVQEQLKARATGTTVLGIRQSELRRVLLPLPSLPEQRAIAAILGSLDDRIELNRRMNQTLEAMAQGLFKSWFVDFDPVRAKAEGRQPFGMDVETAALFPDSFERSGLGEIPSGWKIMAFGDVVELAYGKALREDTRHRGAIPVMGSNGQVGLHDEALAQGPGVVVGRKGNPGTVTWVANDFWPIDTTFYVEPKGPIVGMRHLFHTLSLMDLPALSADSAVPGLNRNIAYLSAMVVPPAPAVAAFEQRTQPLSALVQSRSDESRTLAALRDTLMPKLLSGEIRVREVSGVSRAAL